MFNFFSSTKSVSNSGKQISPVNQNIQANDLSNAIPKTPFIYTDVSQTTSGNQNNSYFMNFQALVAEQEQAFGIVDNFVQGGLEKNKSIIDGLR